jgi:hypothetical protein
MLLTGKRGPPDSGHNAGRMEKIYSVINNSQYDDGVLFLVTPRDCLIEAQIYGRIIIQCKSRALSPDDIYETIRKGTIREANMVKADVDPNGVDPSAISRTLPEAARYVFKPGDHDAVKPAKLISLLTCLTRSEEGEDSDACRTFVREIERVFPGFSYDCGVIQRRLKKLEDDYGITLHSPNLPSDRAKVPGWIDMNARSIDDESIRMLIICALFFGDGTEQVRNTEVRRDSSLGAKRGCARLSNLHYKANMVSNRVSIFRGLKRLGEMQIRWVSEKKPEIFITKSDLEVIGIENGDRVNLVFHNERR